MVLREKIGPSLWLIADMPPHLRLLIMHPVETVFSSKRFHVRSQFIPTFLFDIHINARMRVFVHASVNAHDAFAYKPPDNLRQTAPKKQTARSETRNLSAARLTVHLHIDLLWPGDIFAALVFILTLNQPKHCVIQVANKHLIQVYVLLRQLNCWHTRWASFACRLV